MTSKVQPQNFEITIPEGTKKFELLELSFVPGGLSQRNETVFYRTYSALTNPNDSAKPEPIIVPNGHGLYWRRCVALNWTDNKDNGSKHSAEGWDFEHAGQWIHNARRAQLCSLRTGQSKYVPYQKICDASQGGTHYYPNTSGSDWTLYWYMNDNVNYYGDNAGVVNCDFVVFRL
jgi:hypothetical protein